MQAHANPNLSHKFDFQSSWGLCLCIYMNDASPRVASICVFFESSWGLCCTYIYIHTYMCVYIIYVYMDHCQFLRLLSSGFAVPMKAFLGIVS